MISADRDKIQLSSAKRSHPLQYVGSAFGCSDVVGYNGKRADRVLQGKLLLELLAVGAVTKQYVPVLILRFE